MSKKSFAAKVRAALSVLLCLVLAVAFWLLVKYARIDESSARSLLAGFGIA